MPSREGKPQDAAIQRGGDPGQPGPGRPAGVPRFAFLGGARRRDGPEGVPADGGSWRSGSRGRTIR